MEIISMVKNITLSADEELIRKARKKAQREHTTLNATFRQWLQRYVHGSARTTDYETFMESLSYARAGRSFTRDEMNER
jgi:hypothetical protein